MNTDKNGTFKLGADLNATGVPTPKKWYVDGDFRGTLKSVEGNIILSTTRSVRYSRILLVVQ